MRVPRQTAPQDPDKFPLSACKRPLSGGEDLQTALTPLPVEIIPTRSAQERTGVISTMKNAKIGRNQMSYTCKKSQAHTVWFRRNECQLCPRRGVGGRAA